ncbi:MAG: PAS domain S-box protein [Bacteroidetes bacterium]|nr:PAS domain S-box protein [Bacteroidota bacterium]
MNSKIKILHLEDNDLDAELLQSQLEIEGIPCEITRVFHKAEFIKVIEEKQFDLILSDNTLPDFDGIDALRYAKKIQPETPFIFLSGTLGEDVAIEAMRWGATDYVLKQRIEKFGVTVKRVLEESRRKKELEYANRKIRENEERLKIAQEVAHIGTWEFNVATKEVYFSDEQYKIFGYKPNQISVSLEFFLNMVHPDDKQIIAQAIENLLDGKRKEFERELRIIKPDETVRILQAIGKVYPDEKGLPFKIIGTVMDITEQRQAEEAIRRNEERLRISLSTVNIAVFHQNEKLKYTWMYQPQLGYKPEEVIGKTDFELLPREAAEEVTKIKRHVLETKQKERAEVAINWKGQTFYFDLVVEPLLDSNGKTIGITGATLDITEREKMLNALAESEEKFRSLFENAVLGLYRTTPSGEILMINPALAQMLGCSSWEELKQRNLEEEGFQPVYPRSVFKQEIESKGVIVGNESVWTKKNGDKIFIRESAKAIKDKSGKVLYYEGTVEDITERKKMEEELIKAKEKAEEMDRLKSHFLSNMSHELRTPMIAIMGYSEILQKEIADQEHLAMVEGILDGATRLNTTLDSILELSKIESGNTQLTFSVHNLVDEVEKRVSSFRSSAERKNLSLKIEASEKNVYAEINPDLFGNALFQLISNGIKFTKQGGVLVQVTTEQAHGRHLAVVRVKDTGIGISPAQHKKIFGEFIQASQGYNRHFEGAGIGLTIAMKSIQLMKGEITLESQPGKGSVFVISLPLKLNETQLQHEIKERRRTTTIEEPPSSEKNLPCVLMVEDNISNRTITKLFLKNRYEITEAADGITALALASKKQFDLVLMDINLGEGIDGIETMKRLRDLKGYKNVPVIAVTAYVMSGDRARLLECGFDAYVPKPFTKEILIDAIRKKLHTRH